MINFTTPASRNYFSQEELQCRCKNCTAERRSGNVSNGDAKYMISDFIQHLNRVRENVYCRPMPISSGYRCSRHPIEARKRKQAKLDSKPYHPGDHPSGVGVDVSVYGANAHDLIESLHIYNWWHTQRGMARPFTAICPNQRGPYSKRFIHVGGNTDSPGRPRPWLWTY
ncbi:Peptidase M15 [Microbulbifer sp. THAF38]|nr:Peptidase M15 [Microbulbifer sp. THAF38]